MNQQRQLERLAIASLTEDDCPSPDQLAAYMLGTLASSEQLTVAAHIRGCPLCSRDLEICQPPKPRPQITIARLLPFALPEGRRSSSHQPYVRQYIAADVIVELTIAPPDGDVWRITGQVMRTGVGLANRIVSMRSGRRRYQQASDADGFFTFVDLPTGRYTLTVIDDLLQIQIRALVLGVDEQ